MANCAVWDLTLHKEHKEEVLSPDDLIKVFRLRCKKWSFQLERGEKKGRLHYQCRVSFKTKCRQSTVLKKLPWSWVHVSPTSEENRVNDFYVTKEETREAGPWRDTDFSIYVQKRFRDCKLRPWQQQVIDSFSDRDDRIVDVFVDEFGNKGKGFLAGYAHSRRMAFKVPPINDSKDLMAIMCDRCEFLDDNDIKAVFVDLPRSMPKSKLQGIFSAIEQIKDGYLYDTRYRFKECWIEPPAVWVFTNEYPPLEYLSVDRWRFWELKDDKLKRVDPTKNNF